MKASAPTYRATKAAFDAARTKRRAAEMLMGDLQEGDDKEGIEDFLVETELALDEALNARTEAAWPIMKAAHKAQAQKAAA